MLRKREKHGILQAFNPNRVFSENLTGDNTRAGEGNRGPSAVASAAIERARDGAILTISEPGVEAEGYREFLGWGGGTRGDTHQAAGVVVDMNSISPWDRPENKAAGKSSLGPMIAGVAANE